MNTPLVANDLCIRPFGEEDVTAFVEAVRESAAYNASPNSVFAEISDDDIDSLFA